MRLETSGGATLQLQAIETLASVAAVDRFREQLIEVLVRRLPVSITVDSLGTVPEASFGAVCSVLRSAIEVAGVDSSHVWLAIDAATLAPQQAWLKRCEVLGPGPLYLLAGSSLTPPATHAGARRRQEKLWQQCWHLRNCKQVRMALAPVISSPCPLLSSESASGILPPFGLQTPSGTAWIQMQLDLTEFANECGELDVLALHQCLHRCIDLGESMHDETEWSTAAMRHDAWLNRRLAISVIGIGDLATMRGLDPGCFNALQELGDILQGVRELVDEKSRQLAARTQPTPALNMIDACRNADWQARWHKALEFSAMRHRNLLVMSPWAMFPSTATADSRYCDFLPLLKYSDACSFPAPPSLRGWNINEFKYFHHRVSAVLGRKDARQLIAEQV